MNQDHFKNECAESEKLADLAAARGIPVQFFTELAIHLPIKIQPHYPMSDPTVPPAQTIVPTLFQIAARADDPESLVAFKKTLASGHAPHAERMLDREKLEAILDAAARKKKPAPRRTTGVRFEKRLSVSDGLIA
jgi:hypothetical protein